MTVPPGPRLRLCPSALRQYVSTIFEAAGSSTDEASIIADHLVDSNLVGHDSHGILRVPKYLEWIAEGAVRANRSPLPVIDTGPVVIVDGRQGYGQVIVKKSLETFASRATLFGVAVIGVRNAGHVGRVGAWAELLAADGFASLHFVNTSGFGMMVAPYGAKDRRLSANPIAAGMPVPNHPPLIVDVATAAIAEGKIMLALNQGESIPADCLLDGNGNRTRDPAAFYADPPGAILPFGGHKGFAISILCEMLAGSLTGGGSGHPENPSAGRFANNMMSIVFSPMRLGAGDSFLFDIERFVNWVKSAAPIEEGYEIRMPGERAEFTRSQRLEEGIPVDASTYEELRSAAALVGLADGAAAGLILERT